MANAGQDGDKFAADKLVGILQNDKQIIDLQVRVPTEHDRVYKDECAFTFETPESEHGLYICMRTFLGVGRPVVEKYFDITKQRLFLRHKRLRRPIVLPSSSSSSPKTDENGELKPKRLAIGIEGGFQPDAPQYEFEDHYAVVLIPQNTVVKLPDDRLPAKILQCVAAIQSADAASRVAEAKAQQATWDGEFRVASKHYASLIQLDNGKRVPPGPKWHCEHPGCNVTENLWLNLSDGVILCGRKMWDGSGGNNHGVDHYNETKSFPLAVKLGTITPEGADVFSYEEDDMVLDPLLAEHLLHWHINITQMKKTEKTLAEIEIEWNQKIGEWSKMTESDAMLQDVYGPGYTGMENLGNSCYMNSVMQVMFSLEPFVDAYAFPPSFDRICFGPDAVISKQQHGGGGKSAPEDFSTQLAKLGNGLTSGFYSQAPAASINNPNSGGPPQSKQIADSKTDQAHRQGIRPLMFKNIIGKDHRDFSTKQQQDAYEFFIHLLSMIERNNVGRGTPGDLFKFEWEIRTQCMESFCVRYSGRLDNAWSLPINLDDSVNKDDLASFELRKTEAESRGEKLPESDHIRASVPLNDCIRRFMDDTMVDDFYSTAVKKKVLAVQRTRFASFPKYLLLRLERYVMGPDWTAKKLDVSVHVPDVLNLEDPSIMQGSLRGTGFDAGKEQMLPDETEDDRRIMREHGELDRLKRAEQQQDQKRETVTINEGFLRQLVEMGFPVGASRKALFTTKGHTLEAATNWLMEHSDDVDFYNDDWQPPSSSVTTASQVASTAGSGVEPPLEHHINSIIEMGFNRPQAMFALRNTQNNVERAIDWIFNHQDELVCIQTEADFAAVVAADDERRRATAAAAAESSQQPQQQQQRSDDFFNADDYAPQQPALNNNDSDVSASALKLNDGPGRYLLKAFISHMGPNTSSGHYVCHIKKNGRWVIFNDEKVALSEKPPRDLAYLYLFERADANSSSNKQLDEDPPWT